MEAEGGTVEVSDEVAAQLEPVGEGEASGPVVLERPVIGGAQPWRRRGRSDTHERKLIVMEWITAPGNLGLSMEFYLAKGPEDAAKLRDRLQALPLPDGASERTVHVQPARRWPLSDDELVATFEGHKMYAEAILAGRAAEAEQSDQEVADDG